MLFVFDLDGVIYRGDTLLPGVKETLQALKAGGAVICFLSNNSTLSRRGYVLKLRRLGLHLQERQLFTSSYLLALYLTKYRHIAANEKVMVIGEQGIYQELARAGIPTCSDPEQATYLAVGMDRKLTFDKLTRAYQAILNGAEFIATNADATYPLEKKTIPASGAIVRALEASTGQSPLVLGKPDTFGFEILLNVMGCPPSKAVMVGDRLETDMAVGNKVGTPTVLVLSGISSREEAAAASHALRPTHVIEKLTDLLALSDWVQ